MNGRFYLRADKKRREWKEVRLIRVLFRLTCLVCAVKSRSVPKENPFCEIINSCKKICVCYYSTQQLLTTNSPRSCAKALMERPANSVVDGRKDRAPSYSQDSIASTVCAFLINMFIWLLLTIINDSTSIKLKT